MATPGVTVNVTSAGSPVAIPTSTGTWFVVGQAQRGPTGVAISVQSMTDVLNKLGARTSNTAQLYDALDVFFQEGGTQAWVSRVVGTAAASATLMLRDRAGTPLNTLAVNALGQGIWGNSVSVQVSNGTPANSFVLQTYYNGVLQETSPPLFSPADAVNWAATSSAFITCVDQGSTTGAPNNNPAVLAVTALAGGVDDYTANDAAFTAGLAAFPLALGPGQVSAPGRTTAVTQEAVANHGQAFNRVALLDATNTATAATITAAAATVQSTVTDPSYAMTVAPWVTYPGVPTGTATPAFPRTVAPSAAVAGLIARSDAAGNNADVAAAGPNGVLRNAINVTQTYVDSDRGLLDAAGVAVIRSLPNLGTIELYGYTSMAIDPNWSDFGNVRLRMQIVDTVRIIGHGFMFADIDGQGHTAAAFGGAITGFLSVLYNQGALYGATPSAAFQVNVGPSVNTPNTANARQLLASVSVRMSPTADQVVINVTRYPVTQQVPAA